MLSYKDALINAWTKNNNHININELRKVYSDVYFENHKHKTSFQNEEYRINKLITKLGKDSLNYGNRHNYYKIQDLKKELQIANNENDPGLKLKMLMKIGRSNTVYDGSIYRIIRQFGYKVPMSNGNWQYEPISAEANCDSDSLYFEVLTGMVHETLREWLYDIDKKEKYELCVAKPFAYYSGMLLNCSIISNVLEIPIRINLRKKSLGVHNPFTKNVEITFHDQYHMHPKDMFANLEKSIVILEEMFIK